MEAHSRGHKREDRKTSVNPAEPTSLMDRLVAEHTIELVGPDDVTYTRFATRAHISKSYAKALLEELANSGELKRVIVKQSNGSRVIAYRE